jgi:hypothetical protein
MNTIARYPYIKLAAIQLISDCFLNCTIPMGMVLISQEDDLVIYHVTSRCARLKGPFSRS